MVTPSQTTANSLTRRNPNILTNILNISNSQIQYPRINAQNPGVEPSMNQGFAAAQNRFAFKLFAEINRGQNNTFISPLSVAIALGMVYNGASGPTQQAMANALELQSFDLATVNQSNQQILANLLAADPQVQLDIANSLWVRRGTNFQANFLASNQQFYRAAITESDFDNPATVELINSWVSQNTKGKITQIIDSISPEEILFLINAIYFKGNWARQFNPTQTTNQPFYLANGSQKNHPLMQQSSEFRYLETDQFQAISLPYGRGRFSMYVFLPKPSSNLASFSQQLNSENWQQWRRQFNVRPGTISLPKFKLEYEADLIKSLGNLGMGVAFTRRADFAAMTDQPVAISQVKHKTVLEVNEEGTEAAAVTSIGVRTTSLEPSRPPFEMKVDRPFFMVIQEEGTGSILFMGNIYNP